MAAPDDGDRRNYYERRQDKQRPAGRKPGENRAEHRKRLRTEKRGKAHNVGANRAAEGGPVERPVRPVSEA